MAGRPLVRSGAVALTVVVLVAGCSLVGGDGSAGPEAEVEAFAAAWTAQDFGAMAELADDDSRQVRLALRDFHSGLRVSEVVATPGDIERDGETAEAPIEVTLDLAGLSDWTYTTRLPLVRSEDSWRVAWTPAVMHPELVDGRRLTLARQAGLRAPIQARLGQTLAGGPAESRQGGLAPLTVGRLTTLDGAAAQALGPAYAAGDVVGESGLEQSYDQRLAGSPSGAVQLVEASGAVVEELATFEGVEAEPLRTTLDLAIQSAADDAVALEAFPTAMVVLEASTGAVRGVANNEAGFDRAFLGEYPPGSTFKVITATAMLVDGVSPDAPLPCPASTRPGDAFPFTNAFGKDEGIVTFAEAFALSCNTTFVNEGFRLGGEKLQAQAEQYGFNSDFDPGIPAVVGKYPLPESDSELAASAIGQGRVSVSPLHMASVAAAARTGTWHAPYLVDPMPERDRQLAEGVAADLTDMMRAVVEDEGGTATNVAIDGVEIGGKTGTAEFGDEEPPETHAWFIGYVGDLAFAVVVEAGGVGGPVAGPIAKAFIENLPDEFLTPPG